MTKTSGKLRFFSRIWKSALILTVLFCILISPPSPARALSIEDERALGKEFLARIKSSLKFIENDTAEQYLRDLGDYLVSFIDSKPFEYNFYMLHDSDLNAFAAPGGHIFVHTGLILSMDSVDELAAVLTHEIAHVQARHLAQRIAKQKKMGLGTAAGILAGVLLGGEAAEALIAGSIAAGMQAQLHYSRNDERQADQMGFDHMLKTGFEPEAMIEILEKIGRARWEGGPHRAPTYLRTHPTGPERMSNLDVLMSRDIEPAPRERADRFRDQFPAFRTIVAASSLSPSKAEETFRSKLSRAAVSEEKALAHLGLGIALSSRSRYEESIQHLRSALSMDSRMLPAMIALGDSLRMAGKPGEALATLDRVMELDEDNQAAVYLMGLCYQQLEQYDTAARYFERLASINTGRNDVFYQLGISYGRMDKLALAHFNFALYFARLYQGREMVFHFRKAEELAEGQPWLLDRIHREMRHHGVTPGKT